MASVSSLGVGSNLDLSALLDKLNAAEQQRLTPLTTQQTSYKAQYDGLGRGKKRTAKSADGI